MDETRTREIGAAINQAIGKVALVGSALEGAAYGRSTVVLEEGAFGMDEVVSAALAELAEVSQLLLRADGLLDGIEGGEDGSCVS